MSLAESPIAMIDKGLPHPNFILDTNLLHESDVSNYLIENTPNFSNNPSQLNPLRHEELIKTTNPNLKTDQSVNHLTVHSPKPILRKTERNKTTTAGIYVEPLMRKKDEIIEKFSKTPSLKEGKEGSSPKFNTLALSPNLSVMSSTKKTRPTRLFKGQILENDIFEEKQQIPVIINKNRYARFHDFIEKLAKNTYLEIFFNILIFYALFADDFRTICLPKEADDAMDSITVICIFVFSCEIFVSIMTRKGYFNSFFFYLDIISTLTLFFDITYVYEQIFYKSAFANRVQVARASRATRVGTRAGRLIKFFNFEKFILCLKKIRIRGDLIRRKRAKKKPITTQLSNSTINPNISLQTMNHLPSAKLRKESSAKPSSSYSMDSPITALSGLVRRLSKFAAKTLSSQTADELDEKSMTKESRVGKKLSELTTKRVILIVLLLLLFAPVFSVEYQYTKPFYLQYGIQNFANMAKNNASFNEINETLTFFINEGLNAPKALISLTVPVVNFSYTWVDMNELRSADFDSYEINGNSASIDLRSLNSLDSVTNILRTLLICVIFLIGAMIFSKDANDLALRPIERMIEKVNKIANNPLMALDEGIRGTNQNMETVLIENAIIKIGTLLALGFGDAGSEIIAKNISKGNSGSVNPLIPGKKHFAIFGFCDIRNFTDVTEVLQEEVMLFVNTIASIVHRTIDKYIGNANKNIGDAFLLVWKIPDNELIKSNEGLQLNKTKIVKSLCDLAILSYVKTIARLNSYPKILQYNRNPKINARINNYKVKMGFGLHLGWAIEGAIGSIYKIDASYLSPNVNIASRLEAATKQYGIPILISDAVFEFCSNNMRTRLREIDRVTVKGSKKSLGLFTIDLNLENLKEKEQKIHEKKDKSRKSNHKKKKELLMTQLENDEGKCKLFIENDPNLMIILNQSESFKVFLESFKLGFEDYIAGKWKEAKQKFKECLEIRKSDGPTLTLMNYIESLGFEAPESWKGYRELTEK